MKTIDLLRPTPGLRVLISGAAAGIGAAIAQAFLDVGANVYICDVDPAAIDRARTAHPQLHAGVADVSDRAQVDRIIDDARAKLGGLDLLINNAGIAGPTGAVEDLDPAEWERNDRDEPEQPVLFSAQGRAAAEGDVGQPGHHCDGVGRGTPRLRVPYAVRGEQMGDCRDGQVAGDRTRTEQRARERDLAGRRGRRTMDRVISARAESLGIGFDQMKGEYLQKISLRRMVTVHDVAAMALFLASPAGQNISGQAISVDGNVEYL